MAPTHLIVFFEIFSIKPMPSKTFVMSYILLFYTPNTLTAIFKLILRSFEFWISSTNFFVKTDKELSCLVFNFSLLFNSSSLDLLKESSSIEYSSYLFFFSDSNLICFRFKFIQLLIYFSS